MRGPGARSAEERDLWGALEGIASSPGRLRRTVRSVERRPSPYASSARLEEVDVVYADGTRGALIFKQLGTRGLLPAARLAKPRFLHDPSREIRVYRDLLARHSQGTPCYLGSVMDARRGRYWLFLERVPGMQLRWASDQASWERTAQWLAGTHTMLQGESGREDLPLVSHDRAYYLRWLARARRFATTSARYRRKALEGIASGYHRVMESLVSLPRTVVHGQFYPSNVVVDEASPTGRICVVDWEVAGVGPGVVDLAALTAGAPTDRRDAMVDAYLAALPRAGTSWDRPKLDTALAHARLANAVQWLGWSAAWSAPPEQAHDWLTEAADLAEQIR